MEILNISTVKCPKCGDMQADGLEFMNPKFPHRDERRVECRHCGYTGKWNDEKGQEKLGYLGYVN